MMILLRLAILGGMIWLLWFAWRQLRPAPPQDDPQAFKPTVRCCVCDVVLPRENAQRRHDRFYCSKHDPDAAANE